jgi:hypothetical protein
MKLRDKISLLLIGSLYVIMGVLILRFPKFLYYWVAGVFLVQGMVSLFRLFSK